MPRRLIVGHYSRRSLTVVYAFPGNQNMATRLRYGVTCCRVIELLTAKYEITVVANRQPVHIICTQ